MTIGPDGMQKIVGILVTHPELFDSFRYQLVEFAKAQTGAELSEEEKVFLHNPYIVDLIKDFIERIDIKYDDKGGVLNKGR